jgi:uncharacterized RDD family membrane protein YckC
VFGRLSRILIGMRKTRVRAKWGYLVVCALILIALQIVTPLNPPVFRIVYEAVLGGLWVFGMRVFRGKGEPVKPARAWWRATYRPRAGRVIGIFLALETVADAFNLAFSDTRAADLILGLVVSAVLCFVYFYSTFRLLRYGGDPRRAESLPERG